ncbi:phosphomethylpyrimidine kinase family protein [Bordetella holmesii ATCC 51541]|nr:phosphomethylpyrimidine kinase family protein [Bordetella holmesii ATCC 51541]
MVEHMRLAQWQSDGSIDTSGSPSPAHALLAGGAQWALVLASPVRPGHLANVLVGQDGSSYSWPWQAPPPRSGDTGGLLAAAAAALLASGKDIPAAVEQALPHAERGLAASFTAGMGRPLPNRLPQP